MSTVSQRALERAADAAVLGGSTARAVARVRTAIDHVDAQAQPARAALLYERLARLLSESGETEASLAVPRAPVTRIPAQPSPERAQVSGRRDLENELGDLTGGRRANERGALRSGAFVDNHGPAWARY